MVLLEDTRNKEGKHKNVHEYCRRKGLEIVRKKLDVGDYMLPDGNISVDTKEHLDELARNLMNRSDRSRFWREVRRARETGIVLIVLCEHGNPIRTINDVPKWKSRYSQIHGRRLLDEMIRLEMSYGIRWVFCDKRSTGKRIIELLTEEGTGDDAT